jgi:hypothetical protein
MAAPQIEGGCHRSALTLAIAGSAGVVAYHLGRYVHGYITRNEPPSVAIVGENLEVGVLSGLAAAVLTGIVLALRSKKRKRPPS